MIDQQRIADRNLPFRFDLMRHLQAFEHLLQAAQHPFPHLRIERPEGPLQDRILGNDVAGGSRMKTPDGQHGTVSGGKAAADDTLELRDQIGSRHDGVDTELAAVPRALPCPSGEC